MLISSPSKRTMSPCIIGVTISRCSSAAIATFLETALPPQHAVSCRDAAILARDQAACHAGVRRPVSQQANVVKVRVSDGLRNSRTMVSAYAKRVCCTVTVLFAAVDIAEFCSRMKERQERGEGFRKARSIDGRQVQE
ncbi:unnamed protein product [Phytophthora lilii]|uniref:Unnamed protein product n=1 Tax=Phytophthora lilii TaxID=2077276 RepID=A0A9W6XCT3_9STRA|nr:unnamed protein product [Phytophthora lilii]